MTRAGWICGAGLLTLGLLLGNTAQALSVSPTVVEIDGQQVTRARVRVTAPGNASLVLDLTLLERAADGSLMPAQQPAFELRPPQLLVPAGRSADINLQWQGAAPATASRSFYLVAEQLPVAMERGSAQNHIHMLARVYVPVHVGNTGAANLRVAHDGSSRIVLSNTGTRYARFVTLELHVIAPEGGMRRIHGLELARVLESDALLPGAHLGIDASAIGLAPDERAVALMARP